MKVKHYLAAAALLLTMATAAQAATTPPIVTYVKGGQTYTMNFASACGTGNALKNATEITATGTWTSTQVGWLEGALGTGTTSDTNTTLLTADLSAAVWNAAEVYELQGLFKNCTALTTVKLPAGGAAGEATFSQTFYDCKALTSVTNLSKFTKVSCFNNTFRGCSALQSVTLSASGSSADAIDFTAAFLNCSKLTSIVNIEKFTNVNSFSNAFSACPILESVTLCPEGSTVDNDIEFNSAFYGCKALTSIANLDKYTKASNFSETFRNCTALKDITLPVPADATKSITFQYAFSGCTALERVANLDEYKNVS